MSINRRELMIGILPVALLDSRGFGDRRDPRPADRPPAKSLAGSTLTGAAACALLLAMPEMGARGRYVERESRGEVHLCVRIVDSPRLDYPTGSPERMWHLAAAENHQTHLSAHRFYGVDADSGAVYDIGYDLSGGRRLRFAAAPFV